MTDYKEHIHHFAAIGAVVVFVTLIAVLYENPNPEVCDRLEPCCYGQGKPDFITHLATGEVWKYWEKVERKDPALPTLFELWHFNANDTSLFYDNTTKYTLVAGALPTLRDDLITANDEGLVSDEAVCWLNRMVEYLD